MASARQLFMIFFSIIFAVSSASSSISSHNKVSVSVYYETLCPDCSDYFVNYLAKLFDNGLISIIDLDLIPYGNARVLSNGTITCQHGPNECMLNTIDACVISVYPDLNEHFKFINCVELLVVDHKYSEWESCFEKTGLSSEAVMDCYKNGEGDKLELRYAEQTNSLSPPHRYVPWVLVNGQPIYEDYEDIVAYICKAYQGKLPEACEHSLLVTSLDQNAEQAARVYEMLSTEA